MTTLLLIAGLVAVVLIGVLIYYVLDALADL